MHKKGVLQTFVLNILIYGKPLNAIVFGVFL